MKQLLSVASLLLLLGACANPENEMAATPGLYVRQFDNEFGSGWDSVWVEVQPGVSDGFLIRHRVATTRKDVSGGSEPAQKELVLPATWYPQDGLLVTSRLGRRYSFPDKGVMMLGTARYERVGKG